MEIAFVARVVQALHCLAASNDSDMHLHSSRGNVLRPSCIPVLAHRRFETSSPMAVQLLLLHDQWLEGVDDDPNAGELGEERQLM